MFLNKKSTMKLMLMLTVMFAFISCSKTSSPAGGGDEYDGPSDGYAPIDKGVLVSTSI